MGTRSARRLIFVTAIGFSLAACGGGSAPGGGTDAGGEKAEPAAAAAGPAEGATTAQVRPAERAPATQPARAGSVAATPGVLPDPAAASEQAPASYGVKFETTAGDFMVEVHRYWSPNGADRFYNLVKSGFYDDVAFFRVISGFMVQFGIHGDPAVNAKWRTATIPDDPVLESNKPAVMSFATSGANSRTTQVFINFVANARLDDMGFSPFGMVVSGMDVVNSIYSGYGESAPRGKGPRQDLLQTRGNAYLKESFPELDYVKRATIVK